MAFEAELADSLQHFLDVCFLVHDDDGVIGAPFAFAGGAEEEVGRGLHWQDDFAVGPQWVPAFLVFLSGRQADDADDG